jgi:DnaD/phage-associated family protein
VYDRALTSYNSIPYGLPQDASGIFDIFQFLLDVNKYQKELCITPEEFYLIFQIATYRLTAGCATGQGPSLAEIARRSGKSQETIHGYKRSLVKKGLLVYRNKYEKGRGQVENEYDLTPLKEKVALLTKGSVVSFNTPLQKPETEIGRKDVLPTVMADVNLAAIGTKKEPLNGANHVHDLKRGEQTAWRMNEQSNMLPSPDTRQVTDGTENDPTQNSKTPPLNMHEDYIYNHSNKQSYFDHDADHERPTHKKIARVLKRAGILASPMAIEIVSRYSDGFPMSLVEYAFLRATMMGQPNLYYVGGIFKSWRAKGITTVEQAKAESENNSSYSTLITGIPNDGTYDQAHKQIVKPFAGRIPLKVIRIAEYSEEFITELKALAQQGKAISTKTIETERMVV